MMTPEQKELAEVIKPAASYDYWPQEAARLVLAAGYSKPRSITDPKELDALPQGQRVADMEYVWTKCFQSFHGPEHSIERDGWINVYEDFYESHELAFPVTVL